MKYPIGGYLPLELDGVGTLPPGIPFNLGRSALGALAIARRWKSIAVPRYICPCVFRELERRGVRTSFYDLDGSLEPVSDTIPREGPVLYVNYFGLKDAAVERLARELGNRLVLDLTQAFFYAPPAGVAGFNSARKFIGVPDGAFLIDDSGVCENEFPVQEITPDSAYLFMRADGQTEAGYSLFRRVSDGMDNWGIRRISRLSETILRSADLDGIARKRRENFLFLDSLLRAVNQIKWDCGAQSPLVYPLLLPNGAELRKNLIAEKIFVPAYWPGLESVVCPGSFEAGLIENLVNLPVDQNCGREDLEYAADLIKTFTAKSV